MPFAIIKLICQKLLTHLTFVIHVLNLEGEYESFIKLYESKNIIKQDKMSSFGEIVEPASRTIWEDWDDILPESEDSK